jgi:hypothetical protein
MNKVSSLIAALRLIKDRYEWSIEGGSVVCKLKGSRAAAIEPMVALARTAFGRPGLRRVYGRWANLPPFEYQNFWDFVKGCRRPGRRMHSARQRWVRKLVVEIVGLGACDE